MSPADLVSFLQSYKGGVSVEEGQGLCRYAEQCCNEVVVEIGSFRGKSSIALAAGLARGRFGETGRVYCIDPHETFRGVYGGVFGPADRRDFFRIMLETGFVDRVSLINLRSEAAAKGWSRGIGLLFVDGDHSAAGVRLDVASWERHVAVGGTIIFDDALDPRVGPCALIDELVASGRFETIETIGKMVAVRKLAASRPVDPCRGKKFLVACHEIAIAGGLYRFERFGRVITQFDHQVAFLAFSDMPQHIRTTEFPVLTFDEAASRVWDATFVPGAGFPDTTIDKFSELKRPSFGVRVQHVLNDQTRKPAFLAVNRSFEPHVVVFNNRHWTPGDFTDFQAEAFHFLEGAVDLVQFSPDPARRMPRSGDTFVVGGLATKNSEPLVEAVRKSDPNVRLHLFGPSGDLARTAGDLVAEGRLTLFGPLDERDLPGFYAGVDCVVHTERAAGWANLAAEAMACGLPVVCTPHGTRAFAEHEETAIVVSEPDPEAFARSISRLRADDGLAIKLARNGRKRISSYSWTSYSAALLRLARKPSYNYYTFAPEFGLFGKWPPEERLDGLQPILEACPFKSVCDLGAGDGLVSRWLLNAGASLVHGFERDPTRVALASRLCCTFENGRFLQADVSNWLAFENEHIDRLLTSYDIVLYLGLHHHLPSATRMQTLAGAAARATTWLAIRMPSDIYTQDCVERTLRDLGFTPISSRTNDEIQHLGSCFVFRRH